MEKRLLVADVDSHTTAGC